MLVAAVERKKEIVKREKKVARAVKIPPQQVFLPKNKRSEKHKKKYVDKTIEEY